MTPTFDQVKEFCLDWGFDVEDSKYNHLPYSSVPKMLEKAQNKYGENFRRFMVATTTTTAGFTYMCAETWEDLEDEYNHWFNP